MNAIVQLNGESLINTQDLFAAISESREGHQEKAIRYNDFINRVADELEGEHYETFVVQNPNKTYTTHYQIGVDQAKCVAMRESKSVRRSVCKYIDSLQSKAPALPDFTNPVEAARAWADAKESEQKALAVIEADKPKIAVYEQLADRKSDISTTLMAKQLEGCRSAIQLNKWLREQGIKMQAIDAPKAGYGDCFNVISDIRNGHEFTQCLITPEGQIKIAEKWAKSIGGDV